MGYRIVTTRDGAEVSVDGRDVAAWAGRTTPPDPADDGWRADAADYVDTHPRPAGSHAAAQRMAVLRRLAAGPARREELLAAMRDAAGWVGADDLENRLRDLKASDRRVTTPAGGLALRTEGDRYWLAEPLAALDEQDRRALGFAKAMLGLLDGPLVEAASRALERVVPGIPAAPGGRPRGWATTSARDLQRFDAALAERRPVQVRYFSMNSGRVGTYTLVPVEYVTLGAVVKAVCVDVTADGQRAGPDRQFALERIRAVEDLPGWERPPPEAVALERDELVMDVDEGLYAVLAERNVFGIGEAEAHDNGDGTWRVRGTFARALSWDVLERLCAWAGSAQVHAPLWLVNAVCRRLRSGLRVMEVGGPFEVVKPEPDRVFADHGEAIHTDAPLEEPTGPTKLAPPER
jgi:hypothetical protein